MLQSDGLTLISLENWTRKESAVYFFRPSCPLFLLLTLEVLVA